MKRRVFTILSALSLLLLISIGALWLRSHRTHDSLLYRTTSNYWHLASVRGRLWLFVHEPRHRLTKLRYTSHFTGVPFSQTSEAIASAAYEHEAAVPRLYFDRYPVVAPDREVQRALDDLLVRQRDTTNVESGLVGLQGNLHIGRITDEAIVRRAERPYVEAMERQMRAWARLQAAVAPERGRSLLGFRWHAREGPGSATPSAFVAIPYWPLLLLTATVPIAHLLSNLRSRRRTRLALCPSCGYDLRATPDQCPECGAVPRGSGAGGKCSMTNAQ